MSKTLGIFRGKKSLYNQLILKSLATGFKSTVQIAEYVYSNDPIRKSEVKGKIIKRNEIKNVQSVICRKGSRLQELSKKQYIQRKNSLWRLTYKGSATALTLFSDLSFLIPFIKEFNPFGTIEALKDMLRALTIGDFLLKLKKVRNLFDQMAKPHFYLMFCQQMRDFTKDMIEKGVDIDAMSDKEFKHLISVKIASRLIETLEHDVNVSTS